MPSLTQIGREPALVLVMMIRPNNVEGATELGLDDTGLRREIEGLKTERQGRELHFQLVPYDYSTLGLRKDS